VREFQLSQLFRTVGLLVKGGTPLPRALALCSSLLGVADRARLSGCVAAIEQGQPLARAFETHALADPAAAGMLTVAERTGSLGAMLDRIAQFKEARLQRAVEWTSRLVEPVLMIVIGLVIGGIVVLMYLPIFDLASSLQ
jgi:general secretion pathway protein F